MALCEHCDGPLPRKRNGKRRYCSDRCRMAASRTRRGLTRRKTPVSTVHLSNNAEAIRHVARLYIKDGQRVADVTYGRGAFWRKTNTSRFQMFASDIAIEPFIDFRNTPYAEGFVDHVVLDPPFMHTPGKTMLSKRYRNTETHGAEATDQGRTFYHEEIMADYRAGMVEAKRILRSDGLLWVKCKDEVESGRQCWSHIEVNDIARDIGMVGKDLFVIVPTSKTPNQHKRQVHARKAHSYLWIFQKC